LATGYWLLAIGYWRPAASRRFGGPGIMNLKKEFFVPHFRVKMMLTHSASIKLPEKSVRKMVKNGGF
jgi:hypothetical protein